MEYVLSDALFRCDDLPLHALFVVRSSACWTQAVHVVLDIVVAKLANLERVSIPHSKTAPLPLA